MNNQQQEDTARRDDNRPRDDRYHGWPLDTDLHEDRCQCEKSPYARGARPCFYRQDEHRDPCEDLIRMLQTGDGRHKPKQRVNEKMMRECECGHIRHVTIPVLMMLLKRYLDDTSATDAHEREIREWLDSLTPEQRDHLIGTLKAYHKLAQQIRDCVFESRFDNWPDGSRVNWEFVGRAIADEVVKRGRQTLFDSDFGLPGRGVARPWGQQVVIGWDPSAPVEFGRLETAEIVGPWPWICAVATDSVSKTFFRNRHFRVPGKSAGPVGYEEHEVRKKVPKPGPGQPFNPGPFPNMTPSNATDPGSGVFSTGCPNGLCYTDAVAGQDTCIRLPPAFGGASITLKGLNFLSTKCKIQIRRVAPGPTDFGGSPPNPYWADGPVWFNPDQAVLIYDIDCHEIHGDTRRPANVVSCLVEDKAFFELPTTYDDQAAETTRPLPSGFYEVRLMVPNEDKFAFEAFSGGVKKIVVPDYLWSNPVFLDVQPDPSTSFQWTIASAFCHRETSGPGSDEPWISVNAEVIDRTSPTLPGANKPVYAVQAEEIDAGSNVPMLASPFVVYSGPLAQTDPAYSPIYVVCQVLGMEVDSESAAKEQMQDSFEIFMDYVAKIASPTGAAVEHGYPQLAALVGKTWAIGAMGVGIVGLLVGGLFYALWAPADKIIADCWLLDPLTAHRLTLRESSAQEDVAYTVSGIHVHVTTMPIEVVSDETGRAVMAHMYYSPEERSRYSLTARLARNA